MKNAVCTTRRHGEESQVSPIVARILRTRPLRPVSGSESQAASGPEIGRPGGSVFFRFLKKGRKRFSRIMAKSVGKLLLLFGESLQSRVQNCLRSDGRAARGIDAFRALLQENLPACVGDGRVPLLFRVLRHF